MMVLAEMSPDLSQLEFGSFLSSSDESYSTFAALAVDPTDHLVVTGQTAASDFPTTTGSVEQTLPVPPYPNEPYTHSFVTSIDMATPAPSVCLDTWTLTFDQLAENASNSPMLHVTNCGNAPLTITSITPSIPSIAASQDCGSVAPGAVCPVAVTYTPTVGTPPVASLELTDNAAVSPQVVHIFPMSTTVYGSLDAQPNPLSLGHLFVGTNGPVVTLSLTNQYPVYVTISSVTLNGGSFSIANDSCVTSLPPGGSCTIAVRFAPSTVGAQSGSLTVDYSSTEFVNYQLIVPMTGTGDSAYGVPTISQVQDRFGDVQQTVPINDGPVTLTLQGSNFYPQSVVQVGGVTQSSTFVSNSTINVTIAASSLTSLGELPLVVINPTPGGGTSAAVTLTPYQTLSIDPDFVVSVPAKNMLYAAIPASAPANPNTVIPVNPATGVAGTPIPVGNNPNLLAASSDGSYLYVANAGDDTVQRINLATNAVDRTFPYPARSCCPTCAVPAATDLQTVPGTPQEFLLGQGVAALSLFSDTGLVNQVPNGSCGGGIDVESFALAGNPLAVYGLPFTSAGFFDVANLTNSGLQYAQPTGNAINNNYSIGAEVISDGTLLYTSSGQVWDPSTKTQVGTIPFSSMNAISQTNTRNLALDSSLGEIYSIGFLNLPQGVVLSAFGLQSHNLTGSLVFPQIVGSTATNLVRWGADGVAFIGSGDSYNDLYLLRSSLDSLQTNPVPSITSLSPSSVVVGGSNLVLTVNGTGFVPGSVVELHGNRATTYISPTQLTAVVPAADLATPTAFPVTVINPAPGGGKSGQFIEFQVTPPVSGVQIVPGSLDFGTVHQGSSQTQSVYVENSGTGILAIGTISISPADYTQTNTCGSSLASGTSCHISVVFSPTSNGLIAGKLSISDSGPGSPQIVSLDGTGEEALLPVSIGPAIGGSTTATVSPGQTAIYNLTLTSLSGFSGSVSLSCDSGVDQGPGPIGYSQGPSYSTCTTSPSTIDLAAGSSANFTVSVTTTAPSSASLTRNSDLRLAGVGLFSLLLLPLFWVRRRLSSRGHWIVLLLVNLGLLAMTGCSSGGSQFLKPPAYLGSTPGNYEFTITASTANAKMQQALTIIVK